MLPLVSSSDAEADRHALAAEVRDLLPLAVLVDGEVLLAQAGDEAAVASVTVAVTYQLDAALEDAFRLLADGRRRRLPACDEPERREARTPGGTGESRMDIRAAKANTLPAAIGADSGVIRPASAGVLRGTVVLVSSGLWLEAFA